MVDIIGIGDWIGNRFQVFDIHEGGMSLVYVVNDHLGASGAQCRGPEDPACRADDQPRPGQPVRRRVPDLGAARRPPEHRPGAFGRGDRRAAVCGARAGAGRRPVSLDRHAAAGPAAGAPVRLPVLRRPRARAEAGAALPPGRQAGQPAGHRAGDAQDHRLRAGAGLRGDGGDASRAARRLDPAGRADDPSADHLVRPARPAGRRRRRLGARA